MKIKSQNDFFTGFMFMGFGIAFTVGSISYPVGKASVMAPGYFPLVLGILLTLIGIPITVQSLLVKTTDGEKIGYIAWKPIAYVLGANLVFGLCLGGVPIINIPAMGLIVGVYALTIITSLASDTFKLPAVLILATVLAVGSYLIFVVFLKMQVHVWPAFITA